MTELRREGRCKWFRNDYGFIDMGDGVDVFVHWQNIEKDGYRKLEAGERVSFVLIDGIKGRQAVEVRTLEGDYNA